MHSTNVSHFQRNLMDGKLFFQFHNFLLQMTHSFIISVTKREFLLATVRSNLALVNKLFDFFLTGVAFCFKCINCDPTPTSRKFLFPDLPAHQRQRPRIATDQKQQQKQSGARKIQQEEIAQWQHPGGKRSAAVLLPVLLVQYARRHFPPVRSRTYLVTHNTSSHFTSTRPETLRLALTQNDGKEKVRYQKTPNFNGNTANGQNQRHHCLQKFFFLLKFESSETKTSFVKLKNQCAGHAVYKIGHIFKRKIVGKKGGRSGSQFDFEAYKSSSPCTSSGFRFMLFCDDH